MELFKPHYNCGRFQKSASYVGKINKTLADYLKMMAEIKLITIIRENRGGSAV